MLYNLLANAVGFSPQDATVTLRAKRTEHSVIFSVTDSGPGIPADVKDKVFDWFESHSNGSRHRGAGLGLSLVRSFVELHGGKVRVDFDRRQRHDRDLRLSDRSGRAPQRRGMNGASTFSLALANETATAQLMADLALLIAPGDVITLSGDLGAGKTAAARAMIRYLAGDDTLEVPSPTFTLVQSYDLPPFPVVHADLYRINDPEELNEIGLFPPPDNAVALIEWPERAPTALPADRIDVALRNNQALDTDARVAEITGYGKGSGQVARLKALRGFLEAAGYAEAARQRMAGDASTRSYARLIRHDGVVILMNAPRRPDGPAIYSGKSYSAAVHLAEDVKPFVAIAEGLRARGFSAPAIITPILRTAS